MTQRLVGRSTPAKLVSKYVLKYPADWYRGICDKTADDFTVYFGTTSKGRADCDSPDSPGSQVILVSTPAVPTKAEQELGSIFDAKTSEKVKVDGVTGKRQAGLLKKAMFGFPADTLVVRYFFLTPGRSYIVAYIEAPKGKFAVDNIADFDLMVTTTLKFTN